MELNDLPDELLVKIFFHLPIGSLNDLFDLILICKKWYQILWSKQFFQRISSFKYQSNFLVYHYSLYNRLEKNSFNTHLEFNPDLATACVVVDGRAIYVKQNIKDCPLVDITISMWCRTLGLRSYSSSTIFLLWHFHLGYIGFYHATRDKTARIKCTYTQEHQLKTKFALELNEWYHVAIVTKEKKGLQLYINGNKVGNWALQQNISKEDSFIAPYSSIWFGSHCGGNKWHGSLFDVCVWKRCLKPYELKEMARMRRTIENINFVPHLS